MILCTVYNEGADYLFILFYLFSQINSMTVYSIFPVKENYPDVRLIPHLLKVKELLGLCKIINRVR